MKQFITICTLVILTLAGTQNTQAQTKEETIAWIKEKLEKYGGTKNIYYSNVQVTPCSISYTSIPDIEIEEYRPKAYESFNPSVVKSWEVNFDKDGIYADTDAVTREFEGLSTSYIGNVYIRNNEADIHERMIKALKHLATFCEEGKNETF